MSGLTSDPGRSASRLLTIGRFARLSGLSEGALRHYDALGVLRPESVDSATGYRRYSPEQLPAARAIVRLRGIQMPLDEVAAVVGSSDPELRRRLLARHRARLEARAIRTGLNLHRLNHTLDPAATEEDHVSKTALPAALDPAADRAIGAALYNRTWELLGIEDRTAEQDDELIHTAHASRFHWLRGAPKEPVRAARGEWLCARVYSTLERPEPALWHARRCLEIVESLERGAPADGCREDWDLAGAYEGLARAHAIAGDREAAEHWASLGRAALEEIGEAEDRSFIEQDLGSIPMVVAASAHRTSPSA